jgi:two-component system sensor histidine kinase BaeS
MSIRTKLVVLLLGFGFVILGVFLWSNQYVLHSTILHYVDQRDQQRLERLKHNLEVYLQAYDAAPISESAWLALLRVSNRIDLSQQTLALESLLRRFGARRGRLDEFEQRVNLLDSHRQVIWGEAPPTYGRVMEVNYQNQAVLWLGYHHLQVLTERADIEFAQMQSKILMGGALLILCLSLVLLWPLHQQVLQPIRRLAEGLKRLSVGDFSVRLPTQRQDELGTLAQHFNHLAQSLAQVEASRSQWVADTSHELRTPITVLRSSVESMLEGVRPLTTKNLQAVYDEILLLNRLVEDLQQLNRYQVGQVHYQMQRLDWGALIRQALAAQQALIAEKGLRLDWQLPTQPAWILGDAGRLQQLLHNLLHNALAYTDAQQADGTPGRIQLRLQAEEQAWLLSIEDSAPAVSDGELAQLGRRFYRAESSRNRRFGGAGLGLAISREIVQAHQGRLHFGASALGGLAVAVRLAKRDEGI